MKTESNELNEALNSKDSDIKTSKQKFFIIFKLVNSLLYFVPAVFVFALGVGLNVFLMIGAAGESKNGDVSNVVDAMKYIGVFSIIPTLFCLVILIITIVSTVKFFKNKYNKKLDIFIAIVFLLLNLIVLGGTAWFFGSVVMGIIAVLSSSVMIDNIRYIIHKK